MLYVLFQLGKDRYALEASRVVEVLPLLALKEFPQPTKGLAGIFNYWGQPVPAVDLCDLTMGRPAAERLSTRIIVVNYPDETGSNRLVGLIAERATETLRREAAAFVEPGMKAAGAPYLGPVCMDGNRAIQLLHEQRLLSEPYRKLLFTNIAALTDEKN